MLMHLLFHKVNSSSLLLFVSERKQIALFRHEKLFEISRAVLRNELLRNEDLYERFFKKDGTAVRYFIG